MGFLKCILYLAVTGITTFFVGRLFPKKWIRSDAFPYRSFSFEKDGRIYDKINIHEWQDKIPDMSKLVPNLMPTKRLDGNLLEKLPVMIRETCVAELTHFLLGTTALYCFCIWKGIGGIIIVLLYEIGNIPYILVQRYNRPRLIRLLEGFEKRKTAHITRCARGEKICNGNTDTQL